MKNKLTDLNNHLFEQLERINNEELKGEELIAEINRGKAITSIAQAIINNANSVLDAAKFLESNGYTNTLKNEALDILGIEKGENECLEKNKNEYFTLPKSSISIPKSKGSF